jgi:hypothetical protein
MVPSLLALTLFTWGIFGALLDAGQRELGGSSLRPLLCAGLTYALFVIIAPSLLLRFIGESGRWTATGVAWSFAGGATAALGTLAIIVAFTSRGRPVYLVPVVFGLTPLVSTLVPMWLTKMYDAAGRPFFVGVALFALGAVGVVWFRPSGPNVTIEESIDGSITVALTYFDGSAEQTTKWTAANVTELKRKEELRTAYQLYLRKLPLSVAELLTLFLSSIFAAFCWGGCGPILQRGKLKLGDSWLRVLITHGAGYFVVAVLLPVIVLAGWAEPGHWSVSGINWSLAAGAAGATGVLAICMALKFGGRLKTVLPSAFVGALVVNSVATFVFEGNVSQVSVLFLVVLTMLAIGTVVTIVFAREPAIATP